MEFWACSRPGSSGALFFIPDTLHIKDMWHCFLFGNFLLSEASFWGLGGWNNFMRNNCLYFVLCSRLGDGGNVVQEEPL